MSRSFLFTALTTPSVCTGCDVEPVPVLLPLPLPLPALVDEQGPVLAQRIEAMKTRVLEDTCFQQHEDASVCEWGNFKFDPNDFSMTHDTGEAILIMDDFPELPPRAIRYKNRIKGFFRAGPDGDLAPVPFAWHAPVALHAALSEFVSPDFVSAESLRPLSEPLEKVYRSYVSQSAGHGSYVFSVLVEANPHQPIVVLDQLSYLSFALEEFCDASGSAASAERLRAKSEHVADGLRRLIAQQHIRFVNVSSGESLATMRSLWTGHCAGALPGDDVLRGKLNAYEPIVAALYRTEGVFAAQAAIDATNLQDHPFDFPSETYPNRLLVGFFTALESGLDPQGRGGQGVLEGWPGWKNVDLYLNSGVLSTRPYKYNRTPLLQVDTFGVDVFPITRTTTSWITPLALSRFIHARHELFEDEPMSDSLIQRIRNELVPEACDDLPGGRCIYQDPLKHGQIEAVRLGYRAREYVKPDVSK